MTGNNPPLFAGLLAVAVAFIVSGCATILPGKAPATDPRALALARHVRSINQGLETVKGTAQVVLTHGSTRERFKIAWATLPPDKIRLTILETGIPVETLAADGQTVSFVSHTGRHPPHTIKASNPSLKSMVNLPVRIRDIIALLSGQLPLETFDRERLSTTGETEPITLVLSRKWRGTVARVQFDAKDRVVEFEAVARDKKNVYQVSRSDFKPFGPYLVPATTLVKDPSGRTMTLKISSFYPDLPIKASVFTLTETE